mgnify:CR=1 FL=1
MAFFAALVALPVLASAQPRFQPPPDAFQTPSGNVHCLLRAEQLRCQVLEHAYATPPKPAGCTQDWGGRLALRADGRDALVCEAWTVRNDEAFVLGYGARWEKAGISCTSEESGLRCVNQAGHGFQVSRARLELF